MVTLLLGPQRFRPTLAAALDSLGIDGPVACVTAGWQEREAEDDELQEHMGRPAVDLRLYQRYEDVSSSDRELFEALRQRQDRLQQLQELYRLRLSHTLAAARELMGRSSPLELLPRERRSAIRAVRALDAGHLRKLRAVHEVFEASWRPAGRSAVASHRKQIAEQLRDCQAVAVAGGHVAVLLNRLRLFDLPPLLGDRPLVAWSAGAMALGERVVLFHDTPPQGAGDAELLDAGLGLFRRILPLPHASRRLKLDDPVRVALFARRFAPAVCVALDEGSRVECRNGSCRGGPGTLRLGPRGGIVALGEFGS